MIHRRTRKLKSGFATLLVTVVTVALIITKIAPENLIIELMVMAVVGLGVFCGVAWLSGKKKWGVVASLALVGILLMRRWEILDWQSLGIWIMVLGAIGLIN